MEKIRQICDIQKYGHSSPLTSSTNVPNVVALINNVRIVREGWLYKRGEYIRNWKARYFILFENGLLEGYKNKPPPNAIGEPLHKFTVKGCQIMYADYPKPYTFIFKGLHLTNVIKRMFHVDSEIEREEWAAAIRMVSEQLSVDYNVDAPPNFGSEYIADKGSNQNSTISSIGKRKLTLESFEFIKALGKGTFGKVILCREKETEHLYAIKILKKEVVIQKNEVAHTHAENRVLRTTNHPFLISLKYSFQTNDRLYFVMEYVNGGELFFHLNRDLVFSENRSRFYGAEIISAVAYLHSQSIIYRDLKLENLLLDSDGHIKVVDFGLCKEDMTYGRTTNTFCGTPQYIAPEVLGDKDYGRAVDWWSFGVVMYEMMYGSLPFYNRNENVLFTLILKEKVKFPKIISVQARDLLSGLLVKDPAQRLGGGPENANQIMNHPFFSCINWRDLEQKKIPPPFKPQVSSETDTRYFDAEFDESIEITPPNVQSSILGANSVSEYLHFPQFSFQAPSSTLGSGTNIAGNVSSCSIGTVTAMHQS